MLNSFYKKWRKAENPESDLAVKNKKVKDVRKKKNEDKTNAIAEAKVSLVNVYFEGCFLVQHNLLRSTLVPF